MLCVMAGIIVLAIWASGKLGSPAPASTSNIKILDTDYDEKQGKMYIRYLAHADSCDGCEVSANVIENSTGGTAGTNAVPIVLNSEQTIEIPIESAMFKPPFKSTVKFYPGGVATTDSR